MSERSRLRKISPLSNRVVEARLRHQRSRVLRVSCTVECASDVVSFDASLAVSAFSPSRRDYRSRFSATLPFLPATQVNPPQGRDTLLEGKHWDLFFVSCYGLPEEFHGSDQTAIRVDDVNLEVLKEKKKKTVRRTTGGNNLKKKSRRA